MRDLLLPTTDGGALAQAVAVVLVFVVAAALVRRNHDLRWLVAGLGVFVAGLLALRTLH